MPACSRRSVATQLCLNPHIVATCHTGHNSCSAAALRPGPYVLQGYVVVPGVMPDAMCDHLLGYLREARAVAAQLIESGKFASQTFLVAKTHAQAQRMDLRPPLSRTQNAMRRQPQLNCCHRR